MLSETHIHQAQQEIQQASNILLVIHQSPDGDAIGCLTAMREYLDSLKK